MLVGVRKVLIYLYIVALHLVYRRSPFPPNHSYFMDCYIRGLQMINPTEFGKPQKNFSIGRIVMKLTSDIEGPHRMNPKDPKGDPLTFYLDVTEVIVYKL